MAQTVPIDVRAGISKTGVAFGATIYQLDGSTSFAAFSTTGWYEAPAGSGSYHHAGISFPDAGGVIAYGVIATEYNRFAIPAAGVVLADGAITAAKIASDAITAAKIADGAIDAATFAAGAINAAAIATDAITAAKIAADAIGASELAADAVTKIQNGLATPTNITAGTITTVTNLTNAPTAGDLTTTMKTSVRTEATAATPTAAAVTGNVGGNVVGSVTSVTAPVTVGTNSDKTGYTLTVTPPTVAQIRTEIDSNSTQLAKLGTPAGASVSADIAAMPAAILDTAIAEPTAVFSWSSATVRKILQWLAVLNRNKMTQTTTVQTVRNDADNAALSTASTTDDGDTATRGAWS